MSEVLCCFCGNEIATTDPNLLWLTATTPEHQSQTWFCHAACFKARLSDPPGAEGLFEPVHF
jgi:hypothetical protein